jgi:hypothetical protein
MSKTTVGVIFATNIYQRTKKKHWYNLTDCVPKPVALVKMATIDSALLARNYWEFRDAEAGIYGYVTKIEHNVEFGNTLVYVAPFDYFEKTGKIGYSPKKWGKIVLSASNAGWQKYSKRS